MAPSEQQALQDLLREQIPISHAMGITVLEAGSRVVLRAPLEPNMNHKRSVFGGSLYSTAVLAGWSWIWVRMRQAGLEGHIVIQATQSVYVTPVTGLFQAECLGPTKEEWERFETSLKRWGKARLALKVGIEGTSGEALRFNGAYAVLL